MQNSPDYSFLQSPMADFTSAGEKLYKHSLARIKQAQTPSGGIQASLPGTRYAGFIYPRDHAYSMLALIRAGEFANARKALNFLLTCEKTKEHLMEQRYDTQGKKQAYKPPQIDGNALSVIAIISYYAASKEQPAASSLKLLTELAEGMQSQIHQFSKGSLVYAHNGIIEFGPFETGYEIATNAVCYRALMDIAQFASFHQSAFGKRCEEYAAQIKNGLSAYLYDGTAKTFFTCLRAEPDSSYVTLGNIKSVLSLVEFAVFPADDMRLASTIRYHLRRTKNHELHGYNRYEEAIGRHNFGNGPWILVMCRLALYYYKVKQNAKAKACLNWVLQVSEHNLDVPGSLPEHIATQHAFEAEYALFKKLQDVTPRPAKEKEYQTIKKSKTLNKLGLAYAVNPLTWSHAAFILAWKQ